MKRQKPRRKAARKGAATAPLKRQPMTRRDLMGWLKFGAVGAVVVGGGGWYFAGRVMAGIREADLGRLGNGMPTIVQIHDPSCPSCTALQRATRDALDRFQDGQVQYLVANLNDPVGRAFARDHGVGRVTLLLFDGRGKRVGMISGRRSADELEGTFRRYLAQVGARPAG